MINKKQTKRRKWVIVLAPIVILVIFALSAYGFIISNLSVKQNDPNKAIVNAVLKDAVLHPAEIKDALESITVKDASGKITSSPTASSTDNNNADNSSLAAKPSATSSANGSSSSGSSMASTLSELKDNYKDYELVSTSAKNLGGSTYHLTATVRYKKTGQLKTFEVTTQLSENTKDMLKQYRR